MSTQDAPERGQAVLEGPAPRVLLIQAPYYAQVVGGMRDGALAVLEQDGARTEVVDVAGAFELPAALRMALTAVTTEEVAGTEHRDLTDDDVLKVLTKEAKKRREAATAYTGAGRAELAAKEEAELAVLETYLPQQLSEADTKAAINEIKARIGAAGMKDMGKVMAELKAQHGPVLDMSKASGWVKEALS